MPIYPSSSTAVDGTTITENASGEIAVKQSTITQSGSLTDITYSSNTTLTADVYAGNVTIDSGITITTNGYNFYCQGDFTNNGNIDTGTSGNGGGGGGGGGGYGLYIQAKTINAGNINSSGANGTPISGQAGGGGGGGGSLLFSYGSGGYTAGTYTLSGGSGGSQNTGAYNSNGANGGSTLVAGGSGGAYGSNGNPGTYNSTPTLTSSDINNFFSNGMSNYLTGAGGGGGGGASVPSVGGSFTSSYGGSGGGGAGSNTSPGIGGSGGSGIAITFSGEAITLPGFSYSTNSDSIRNRNSTYTYHVFTTESTSGITVASQSLTTKSTGLIAVRVLAKIYNNTIGDGVDIYLYNGTTQIDSDSYTQEGLASNPHLTALYYEDLYTTGTQQTFSVQFNAITGGTASCEIQEFTIEEIY